jgi:hypothetical protein
MQENKFHVKASADFPEGVTDEQIKAAVLTALNSLSATNAEVYAGSDDPIPPKPPKP